MSVEALADTFKCRGGAQPDSSSAVGSQAPTLHLPGGGLEQMAQALFTQRDHAVFGKYYRVRQLTVGIRGSRGQATEDGWKGRQKRPRINPGKKEEDSEEEMAPYSEVEDDSSSSSSSSSSSDKKKKKKKRSSKKDKKAKTKAKEERKKAKDKQRAAEEKAAKKENEKELKARQAHCKKVHSKVDKPLADLSAAAAKPGARRLPSWMHEQIEHVSGKLHDWVSKANQASESLSEPMPDLKDRGARRNIHGPLKHLPQSPTLRSPPSPPSTPLQLGLHPIPRPPGRREGRRFGQEARSDGQAAMGVAADGLVSCSKHSRHALVGGS